MDNAMLVLYANGNIVKKKNGVSYDRKPMAVLSVSRDASYEQLLDHICNRLKIHKTTHQVQLHHKVAVEYGSSIYFVTVPVNDDDAVHELLVNMKGSLEMFVQTSGYVSPSSRDKDSGRRGKRQRRGKERTVLEKYVTFMGNDHWDCNFCPHRSNGRPNRIIAHLTCTPGRGIKICPNMSPEIKEKIANELKEAGRDIHGGEDDNRENASFSILGPTPCYQASEVNMDAPMYSPSVYEQWTDYCSWPPTRTAPPPSPKNPPPPPPECRDRP